MGKKNKKKPSPPKPPLTRIIREGVTNFCPICGSSIVRIGFLGLFGKLSCLQKKCSNYKI